MKRLSVFFFETVCYKWEVYSKTMKLLDQGVPACEAAIYKLTFLCKISK